MEKNYVKDGWTVNSFEIIFETFYQTMYFSFPKTTVKQKIVFLDVNIEGVIDVCICI